MWCTCRSLITRSTFNEQFSLLSRKSRPTSPYTRFFRKPLNFCPNPALSYYTITCDVGISSINLFIVILCSVAGENNSSHLDMMEEVVNFFIVSLAFVAPSYCDGSYGGYCFLKYLILGFVCVFYDG